jgi:hypothetical protein
MARCRIYAAAACYIISTAVLVGIWRASPPLAHPRQRSRASDKVVAQIFNLLYRRFATCGVPTCSGALPIKNRRYSAARASRNQSIISETGKLRTGKFFGKSLLRSHKKSSREGTISSDTDRLQICATAQRLTPTLSLALAK